MFPAMCLDGNIIFLALLWVVILGALCLAAVLIPLVAFARWADARQKRMAAASPALR